MKFGSEAYGDFDRSAPLLPEGVTSGSLAELDGLGRPIVSMLGRKLFVIVPWVADPARRTFFCRSGGWKTEGFSLFTQYDRIHVDAPGDGFYAEVDQVFQADLAKAAGEGFQYVP